MAAREDRVVLGGMEVPAAREDQEDRVVPVGMVVREVLGGMEVPAVPEVLAARITAAPVVREAPDTAKAYILS
jgi:hypothetical protein